MSDKFRIAQAEMTVPGPGAENIDPSSFDLALWEGTDAPTEEELIEVALAASTETKGGDGAPQFIPSEYLKIQEARLIRIGRRTIRIGWRTLEKQAISDLRAQSIEAA